MKIEYLSYDEKPIETKSRMDLYKNAGWWEERKEQDIKMVLESVISVGAWENGKLIGFARAASDGKFRAYVEDVVVHSGFRNNGIGKGVVTKLINELSHIDVVSLFCEEHLIDFYKKNGFKPSKSQIVMHKKMGKV